MKKHEVILVDDGNTFWCSDCKVEAKRSRDNPFPELKHKKAKTRFLSFGNKRIRIGF